MIGEEETISRRRDGAGGSQTDLRREIAVERGTESDGRSLPSKKKDSSMTNVGGRTVRGVRQTESKILESLKAQATVLMRHLQRKRSQTSDCQALSRKTPTHSGVW